MKEKNNKMKEKKMTIAKTGSGMSFANKSSNIRQKVDEYTWEENKRMAETKIKKMINIFLPIMCILLFAGIIYVIAENYETRTSEFTYQGQGIIQNIDGTLYVVCSENPKLIYGEGSVEDDTDNMRITGHLNINSNNFKIPFSLRKKAKSMIDKEVTATFHVTQQQLPAILSNGNGASYKIMWEVQDIIAAEAVEE